LRPKLALSTPGLPLPLPLAIEGEPGSEMKFVIPERDPLTETVAPRAVTAAPLAEPARMGPLTLVSPLAGEVVSGRIPIRIELRQPRSYKYVTISIDGQLKGMTNREPFYVVWDTTQAADGPHEIRAKAFGGTEVEIVVSVTVQNLVSAGRNPYDVAHYRTTSRRLGGLLMHGHPPISVERLMLEAYRQQDPEQALDMYERVLAQDPTRVDLVPPLLALYREQGLALDPRTIPEPHEGIPGARRVALTFDDGPRPEYTTPILDLLRRYEARGTFLVTGRMSEKHPELIKAIAADGHELGNHTYNHLHLDTLSRAEVIYEVLKTKVILDDLTGGTSRLFRPPGGHYNQEVRESIAAMGFIPVFWSINGGSYSRLAPAEAAAAIMRRLRDGAILLLHNGGDNTLPLLPYLLAELKEAGYRCVTVSDLLRSPTEAPVLARPSFGPLPPSQLQGYAGDE
ncbi:MAG: polysaccharide deacetylase family protein, partial [Armatimonadetes bacterium]|nr:polysaccharide deacetylase family protein [Armatimonadota bacterium]